MTHCRFEQRRSLEIHRHHDGEAYTIRNGYIHLLSPVFIHVFSSFCSLAFLQSRVFFVPESRVEQHACECRHNKLHVPPKRELTHRILCRNACDKCTNSLEEVTSRGLKGGDIKGQMTKRKDSVMETALMGSNWMHVDAPTHSGWY